MYRRGAFLEHLALVRERGWAANDGESTPDGTSVAAPIFSHAGEAVAALTIAEAYPTGTPPLPELVGATTEAARRISINLGDRPRAFR
jgi:DNA-binding IclR family transcriptional regulator